MADPQSNGLSRNGGAIAIFGAGIGSAVIATLISQMLSAPADRRLIEGAVKANTAALIGLNNELGNVAEKQDDVRERLTVVESQVSIAGADRFKGEQARDMKKHTDFRLNDLARRIQMLESVCYIGSK